MHLNEFIFRPFVYVQMSWLGEGVGGFDGIDDGCLVGGELGLAETSSQLVAEVNSYPSSQVSH